MIQRPFFTALLCLLAHGVAFAGNPSAPLTTTAVPARASNACTGPSPDPQAATDGFTTPAFCIDFTQNPSPSAWENCPDTLGDGGPTNQLHINGWSGAFPGCKYVVQQTDPTTGLPALDIQYPASVPTGGFYLASAALFEQGSYQITSRMTTTPPVPAPIYEVPGALYAFYQGANSPQFEFDVHENFTLYPNAWDANILDFEGGQGGYLFSNTPGGANKGQHVINPTQYHTFATRVTGDGTTRGYTQYLDGQVVGSFTRGYEPGQQTSKGQIRILQNSGNVCAFVTGYVCQNLAITGVQKCSFNNNTCVTLESSNVWLQNTGNLVWIQGGSGIAGLNGLHTGATVGGNPTGTFELTDLPWPGSSYSGGGVWNPYTQTDVWVQSVQVWSCPNWNSSDTTANQCNGAVVAGTP
jgi:hypothetical protein